MESEPVLALKEESLQVDGPEEDGTWDTASRRIVNPSLQHYLCVY